MVAADVYAVAPYIGRGGWTWYTGSAGWMYRLIVESLLGLRLDVDRLHVAPCLPAHWGALKIHRRPQRGVTSVTVDGVEQDDPAIALVDDHREHTVKVSVCRRLKAATHDTLPRGRHRIQR